MHRIIETIFGQFTVTDEMVKEIVAAVSTRCAATNIKQYRRKRAQQRLEVEAREAVHAVWLTHNPECKKKISDDWPYAKCILKGSNARFEIWIGQDYEDAWDGVPAFEVEVDRGPTLVDVVKGVVATAGATLSRKPAVDLTKAAPKIEPKPTPEPKVAPAVKALAPKTEPQPIFTPPRATSMKDKIASRVKR